MRAANNLRDAKSSGVATRHDLAAALDRLMTQMTVRFGGLIAAAVVVLSVILQL